MGSGSFCKDLKDKLKFIDNLAFADLRYIKELGCREPVIENYFLYTCIPDEFGKFLDLSPAELVP